MTISGVTADPFAGLPADPAADAAYNAGLAAHYRDQLAGDERRLSPQTSDLIARAADPVRNLSPAVADVRARAAQVREHGWSPPPGLPRPAPRGHAEVAERDPDAIQPAAVTSRRQAPNPAELLRKALEATGLYFMDYVAFPSRAALVAVILWTAHAAARDQQGDLIWWASPRLILTSAQNGSGKSTVLDLIAILTGSRVGRMVKVTAYGIAQVLGTHHDIALPDDAQLTFGSTGKAASEIQAVLLGGYTRGGKWVTGKSKGTIESVFGPAAIAGKDALIREQAAALQDLLARSIIVRMERPGRYMPQVDEACHERGAAIGQSLAAVLGALQDELRHAVRSLAAQAEGQDITDGDGGRAAQIWRQLEAIATVAGGPWPAALAEAAAELAAASGDLIAAEDALAGISGHAEGRSFWDEA